MNNNTKLHHLEARLKSGSIIEFSVFKSLPNILMLHGEDMSAQWSLKKIGVELSSYDHMTKLGFHHFIDDSGSYQFWYFDKEELNPLKAFFKSLGYFSKSEKEMFG